MPFLDGVVSREVTDELQTESEKGFEGEVGRAAVRETRVVHCIPGLSEVIVLQDSCVSFSFLSISVSLSPPMGVRTK